MALYRWGDCECQTTVCSVEDVNDASSILVPSNNKSVILLSLVLTVLAVWANL